VTWKLIVTGLLRATELGETPRETLKEGSTETGTEGAKAEFDEGVALSTTLRPMEVEPASEGSHWKCSALFPVAERGATPAHPLGNPLHCS
jgi:hypothetical protein